MRAIETGPSSWVSCCPFASGPRPSPQPWAATGLLSVCTCDISHSITFLTRRLSLSPAMCSLFKSLLLLMLTYQPPHVTVCLAQLFHQLTFCLCPHTESASIFFNVSIFLFERERVRGGEEGDRESEAGAMLSAQRLNWGSNSQTMRSWPELKSDA